MSMPAFTLIRSPDACFMPERYPACPNILVAGGHIISLITDSQAEPLVQLGLADVLDCRGLVAVPGFIDVRSTYFWQFGGEQAVRGYVAYVGTCPQMHMHITGGGGEAGPASRTPEALLSQILNAGITTVVGVLGTDAVSRSQENLTTKSRALQADGITCYHWCGSYRLPSATLTGR
jgi:beta-aspartyl-dipeptidase (metallo-type)